MSSEFIWSDEYCVGVEEIDQQHKALFALLERLRQAIQAKQGSAVCVEILDELVEYTRIHFALEESLMRLARYPDLEAHQQRHRDLIAEVEVMYQKVHAEGQSISFELLHFLRTWLTRHILNEDRGYVEHFRRSGFGVSASMASAEKEVAPKMRKWWKFW